MNLVWGFVLKHWTKLLPVLAAVGFALCVRHTIQANARANAYARVAEMTSHYAQTQEVKRMRERTILEDSVTKLLNTASLNEKNAVASAQEARQKIAVLQKKLTKPQAAALDSIKMVYESALARQEVANGALRETIGIRSKELFDAEQSIHNLENANTQLKLEAQTAYGQGSTFWKITTAIALVGGVAAYAFHP